jgi:hypothetical protein
MPVNPNNLVTIINKNKNKKMLASKIVETNPRILPVVPKLIQGAGVSKDIETDNLTVNRAIFDDLYRRNRSLQVNNEHITKLFPEIELAIQILVSSILSPKKMTDIQLNYKMKPGFNVNPTVIGKILDTIKTYVNEQYEFEEKLPDIIREALFASGAYIQAVIPESSVDNTINTDLIASYATEEFKSKIDTLIHRLVEPINLIVPKANPPKTTKSKEDLSATLASEAYLKITDNISILKYNRIKEKISSSLIKHSLKTNTSIAQESVDKVTYMDIFRKKNSSSGNKNVEIVKTKTEAHRDSIGKPMVIRLPTEATIPVFIPGNESDHLGYFVLLDESGKPLSADLKENKASELSVTLHQSSSTTNLSPIQKAYNNLVGDVNKGVNVDELYAIYKSVLEKQIYTSVKTSLYGSDIEIAGKNDIYFLMFTRALADQRTNLLYIPKELVTYFAFQYNEVGIGKTLLENLSVLSSMRAILLFSKVMAHAKQSIDVTKVNISLDPNDPDPEKTIEQIQDSVLKLRQNFLPLGMNNPVDLLNWIQRAGLQFSYENNPLLPNVRIEFENAELAHTIPSSELEEDLRKQSIIALGLSPETIDNGFTPEFATTVVNNNILLSKRISVYQKTLMKHLTKYLDMLIFNDEDLRTMLRDELLETIDQITETLTEDEKTLLNTDKTAFVEYYINQISINIHIELPKPDNTNISSLSTEYDLYKENLEKVIDSVVSSELFSEDIVGDVNTYIDTVKNVWKHHLLRKWMAENNFFPETLEIASSNPEEIKATLSAIIDHLTVTGRNGTKLVTMLQEYKAAMTSDLQEVSGEPGSSSSASDANTGNEENTSSGQSSDDDEFSLDI